MDDIRPPLRLYLAGVYLVAMALAGYSVVALLSAGVWLPDRLVPALVFLLLAYATERMTARVGADVFASMNNVILVAAVLVLPLPYPVLVALGASMASDLMRPSPLYKRLFNVAHTTILAGGSSLALAWLAPPLPRWAPGHLADHLAALALLGIVYAVIDIGGVHVVTILSDRGGPAEPSATRTVYLLEGVGIGMGVVSAVAWAYSPVVLLLSLLPILTVRATFQAIEKEAVRAEALRRRSERLEAVVHAGRHVRLQQTRADLLHPLALAARAAAGAATVVVYLSDADDPAALGRVLALPDSRGTLDRIPSSSNDGGATTPRVDTAGAEPGTLCLPLEADGHVVGQLRLLGVEDDDEDVRHALALLANQAAVALQNAALHERVLAQVSIDGLTGLLNHRTFHARLDEEIARARRVGQPAGLILIDIDGLAAINSVGSLVLGDATLTAVAATVRHAVRVGDIVARDGGDEFAVFLPGADRDEAIATANHIQAAIRASGGTPTGARVSLGVAVLPHHGATRDELVRAVRQALAGAKALGKDRIAEPDDGAGLMDGDVTRVAAQLVHANLATVKAMAAAVDAKDPYTQGHSWRVSRYAIAVGRALDLAAPDLERLELGGLLHDVGKIAVPDAILKKEERLTDEEFAVIKEHPVTGERMLSGLPYLSKDILPAVRLHHERWDGRGYPDGLAGAALPLDALVMAVADAFDAMTSTRTYRPALPTGEAVRRIREGSGTQFAPHVVLAFERALTAGALLIVEHEVLAKTQTA